MECVCLFQLLWVWFLWDADTIATNFVHISKPNSPFSDAIWESELVQLTNGAAQSMMGI